MFERTGIRALIVATWALIRAQSAYPADNSTTLHFDYDGAEALTEALARDTVTNDQLARLRDTHGVMAMVDNVTRYIPAASRDRFESDLRAFVATRDEPRYGRHRVWQFQDALDSRDDVTKLIAELRRREKELAQQALSTLQPFQPDTGPLAIDVYFVAGGVSDGFVTKRGEQQVLYVNLSRAEGDAAGVIQNLTHEIYHVMQQAAARKVPALRTMLDDLDKLPLPDRLLAETLWEGTANYVANPLHSNATGSYIQMWRSKYLRNTTPERVREHFALFDALLSDLRAQRLSWDQAYAKGFSNSESPLYFVGYEMARIIDERCGPACIGDLLQRPPVEFFRAYIETSKANASAPGTFSNETQRFVTSH